MQSANRTSAAFLASLLVVLGTLPVKVTSRTVEVLLPSLATEGAFALAPQPALMSEIAAAASADAPSRTLVEERRANCCFGEMIAFTVLQNPIALPSASTRRRLG
jgi:hypothetical protein